MPALIVVTPVYVLAPDSVSVPLPDFVKAPPAPDTTPLNVVVALPPTVNVPLPSVIAPVVLPLTSAIEATVSLLLFRSNVAPFAICTALLSAITPDAPSLSVPALIVVVPV